MKTGINKNIYHSWNKHLLYDENGLNLFQNILTVQFFKAKILELLLSPFENLLRSH